VGLSNLALYALVYFAAVATPGPGVAALIARVLGIGLRGLFPFILGFVVGDLIWLISAAAGVSILARTFLPLFFSLKIVGAAYLLYVAWGLVRTQGALDLDAARGDRQGGIRTFSGALFLTLSNPKVIVFFLSIMPLAVDVSHLTLPRFAAVAAVSAVVLSSTLLAYAWAANRAHGWVRSARGVGVARKAAAGVLAGVAVTIVTR
jgi:threonine/homoserine/homoserine lactone efflux protein